jgi:hypothetical protein
MFVLDADLQQNHTRNDYGNGIQNCSSLMDVVVEQEMIELLSCLFH